MSYEPESPTYALACLHEILDHVIRDALVESLLALKYDDNPLLNLCRLEELAIDHIPRSVPWYLVRPAVRTRRNSSGHYDIKTR